MGSPDFRRGENSRRIQGCLLAWFGFALIALFYGHRSATAGSASAPLGVTVRVVRDCSISASSLALSNYYPTLSQATTDLNARVSLRVACTTGSKAAVSIGFGNPSSSGVMARSMSNGMERLSHEIYEDPRLTQVWSESSSGLLSVVTLPSTKAIVLPVHACIPAGQFVHPGSYADSVVVTVNF